jgi:hypothetical protein
MNENRKRVTMHNGRSHRGTGMAFSAKHNDRQFDISQSDHIDPERSRGNRYWRWNQQDTPEQTFEDCEQAFYEKTFADYLQAQNQRHIESRHPSRVKTIEQYRQSRLGRPEQVIMEIGNSKTGAPDPDTLWTIIKAQLDWERKTFPAVRVLDIALHVDEPDSAPHIHVSRVWIAHDKDGHQMQQQEGALREMGVQKPLPESVESRDRYNNRKMTYTRICREHLQELCREYGLDIETEPKEPSQTGRTLLTLKADTLEQETQGIEARRRMAQRDVEDLHQMDIQVTRQINEGYGELADIGLQKQSALEELDAIKHSKQSARERATRAREQAEQQQAKNRTLKVAESEIRGNMEREQRTARQLAEMNEKARKQLQRTQKQLEALKGYLDKAEQRELQEILEREQDGFELE